MSTLSGNSAEIPPYCVEAFNIAADSENKIHDDTVASGFGFAGALVPGSAVFGYMSHQAVARWGRDWLERGTLECRFSQPVYHGRQVTVSAAEREDGLGLEVHGEAGLCATGSAALPAPEAAPSLEGYPLTPRPQVRPTADERSLAEGAVLCTAPYAMDEVQARQWHADLRETAPIYADEKLMHPATLLRVCNWVLTENVLLGPWIHVGSKVRNFAPMPVGASLCGRGVVLRNYEHKGHRLVDLDVLVVIDGKVPAARILHTAIYLPRQVREARASAPVQA